MVSTQRERTIKLTLILNGFPVHTHAQLHDIHSDGEPRGIKYFNMVLNKWTYDQDPKLPLLYSKAFDDVRKDLEENGQSILLDLIQRYMMDNGHKVTVQMFPSTTVASVYENVRRKRLEIACFYKEMLLFLSC